MVASLKTHIGEGGRVVIPAAYRKELNLELGQEVLLSMVDGELRILPLASAVKFAQRIVKQFNTKSEILSDQLIAIRRREAKDA
ncbi:MAG: AbrB/MazE/SpoVT family DNA-binding domain-containing protein [Myxococcaceae bacterium]